MVFFVLIFIVLPLLLICYGVVCLIAAKNNWKLVRFINLFEEVRHMLGIIVPQELDEQKLMEKCRTTGIIMIIIGISFWFIFFIIYVIDFLP